MTLATMDEASRTEYPSMLDNLQPGQAVTVFNERIKRINRINVEIADWLQERRRVEEQYVQSLRRLTQFKVPNIQSELGVFQAPWDKLLQSVESTAHSHHLLSTRIEKDVETPLRTFQNKSDMLNMNATAGNLASMARDLEDAQKKVEALSKKGGKGPSQKLDSASTRLTIAQQQWDSQAPFIFESLQAIDEQRINQLRDLLTQYQTHENDSAQRAQNNAVETLAAMLEVSTELEIASFKEKIVAGKPKLEKRTSTRKSSQAGPGSALGTSSNIPEDTQSEQSASFSENRPEPIPEPKPQVKPEKTESKLRSKLGTMLGRRRQSIHGTIGHLSPSKGPSTFGRASSSHGRPGLSPRTSTSNLGESGRLSSLAETPDSSQPPAWPSSAEKKAHDGTNGAAEPSEPAISRTTSAVNGAGIDASDVPPPLGPPPSQQLKPDLERKDSEGFTVPPPANDPISQAQREAAEEADQLFKLNIADAPIAEEDPEETKAAMSNVASTLTKMSAPSRKLGTIRGRRDVRNTIYIPSPTTVPSGDQELTNENPFPASPPLAAPVAGVPAVAALASQASIAATSDTQSIRSANSLNSLAHLKHPEMRGSGLNSSIIETVSATFEDGVVKTTKINGEIAFSYHAEGDGAEHETIRVNNFANLEAIGPNRIFVHNMSPERPDEFTLDVSHLNKTSTAFTYRVHAADADAPALAEHVPLLLQPAWKPQGDKLGLLLQYSLNPASNLTAPVTLHNVVFVATYEGARASGAQTKPTGTHLKEKQLVYWRVGDVTLTSETQKIICRIVGAEGGEPKPGHVEARWEYTPSEGATLGSGISISRQEESKGKEKESSSEDDPFADEGATTPAGQRWTDVPLVRKIVSGKYEAKSTPA